MLRRHTRCLTSDLEGIRTAAEILRADGLVALPTETVYGLGGNALSASTVRAIFEAKGRPADDPVIVHLASASALERVAVANQVAAKLADAFWPGPLTLVLPKRPEVPPEVTAGLDTVGVRVPSHPVAAAILRACDLPIAAPSANLFGRPSPTTAQHVLDDLDGRIDAVVDGGPATVGVESTIVDVCSSPARLLRPGGVAAEAIEAVLGERLALPEKRTGAQLAPGMLPVHYAPRTPLSLVVGSHARDRLRLEVASALDRGERVGVLALSDDLTYLPGGVRVEVVGGWSEPRVSAARLFDALRALDAAGLDVLFARDLADPELGLGRALADRLRRASRQVLDTRD
ncbi:MAG: threonylcarbamoyl-AMP synthase [Chloroflexi bacterium]|nr:threonylcarbamoyl-AMP synthase [Chloroflexota bacterium]MBV9894569.1 threonylcarbamoyl-AMP synthase [Chloroflexota bacterium]